jgi:hypothetical protein
MAARIQTPEYEDNIFMKTHEIVLSDDYVSKMYSFYYFCNFF